MSENYNLKKEPNLLVLSNEEYLEQTEIANALRKEGKKQEALSLLFKITPILHTSASILKNEMGIHALVDKGYNLSQAVEYYGKEWLEEYAS